MNQNESDKTITCQCGNDFTFTVGEQRYYAERGYQEPKRCKPCREKRKAEKEGGVSQPSDPKERNWPRMPRDRS